MFEFMMRKRHIKSASSILAVRFNHIGPSSANGYCSITEIKIFDMNGVNVALKSNGCNASSNTSDSYWNGYATSIANINDGIVDPSNNNIWAVISSNYNSSNWQSSPHFITFKFPNALTIKNIYIYPKLSSENQQPMFFNLDFSTDGVNFTTHSSFVNFNTATTNLVY